MLNFDASFPNSRKLGSMNRLVTSFVPDLRCYSKFAFSSQTDCGKSVGSDEKMQTLKILMLNFSVQILHFFVKLNCYDLTFNTFLKLISRAETDLDIGACIRSASMYGVKELRTVCESAVSPRPTANIFASSIVKYFIITEYFLEFSGRLLILPTAT